MSVEENIDEVESVFSVFSVSQIFFISPASLNVESD